MLRKSDVWVGMGILIGAMGVGLVFTAPRAAIVVVICFIGAIACFLKAGVEREAVKQLSNTRLQDSVEQALRGEEKKWETYE